jgi:hypothetical protein
LDKILSRGQLIFGLAIAAFGVENLIFAYLILAVRGVPWFPANPVLGYLVGLALLLAGVNLMFNVQARWTGTLLAVFFLSLVLCSQIAAVVALPKDLSVRTVFFETLSMCASAFTLAANLGRGFSSGMRRTALDKVLETGPYLFGFSIVVFGSTHFLILRFIAVLVPAWMHAGMFWAYFTGAALVAAGISILTRWLDEWATTLLGTMFLLWFLLLHVPRIISAPKSHDPNEWSSAFIALAMCGGAWICGWHARERRKTQSAT